MKRYSTTKHVSGMKANGTVLSATSVVDPESTNYSSQHVYRFLFCDPKACASCCTPFHVLDPI